MLTKNAPYKFTQLANAQNFVNRARRGMAIFMGDDNQYWVVGMADAQRLEKAGYEWV